MKKQILGFIFIVLCVGSRLGSYSYRITQRSSSDVARATQVRQSSLALIQDTFRIFFIILKLFVGQANLVDLGTSSQEFLIHLVQTFSVSNLLHFVPIFGGPLKSLVEDFSEVLEHTPIFGKLLSGILVGPDELHKPYSWDYVKGQVTASLGSEESSEDSDSSSQEYLDSSGSRNRNKLRLATRSSNERPNKGDIRPLDDNRI